MKKHSVDLGCITLIALLIAIVATGMSLATGQGNAILIGAATFIAVFILLGVGSFLAPYK